MDESVESDVFDEVERRMRETMADMQATIRRLEAISDHISDSLATLNRAMLAVTQGHSPPRVGDGGGDGILSQFEKRHYNNCDNDPDDGGETDNCCICIERLHRGLVATLHCRHEFHGGCIRRWLRRGHNFCPLCKATAIN